MCQQIIQFCNASTKPLLFVGAFLSFLSALTIGYMAYTTQALFKDIDCEVAQERSIGYYLQLFAAFYLVTVTLLSCFAAHYDQKHSIWALAVISSINCILALAAVFIVPPGSEVSSQFTSKLVEAQQKYNYKENFNFNASYTQPNEDTHNTGKNSTERSAGSESGQGEQTTKVQPSRDLDQQSATLIWDKLQARGCCGLKGASSWGKKIPKSCCAKAEEADNEFRCKEVDEKHQQGCLQLIGTTSVTLQIVLILTALVNLYLALVSGISTYKTFHYSEASQSAYT